MLSRAKKRANKRLTNNLLEGLCFHSDALHLIQSDPDYFGKDAIEVILAACQEDTISTSFSGIEAPHTASCANRVALAEFLDIDQKLVPMPRLLHMIEWDVQNRAELMIIARQTGSCLFGDIASFFRKELQETIQMIKDNPAMVADILAPVIAGGNAMVNHSWCYYHQKQCCIKTAVRHTAGTSCVPFSRRGVNLGLKDVATLYSLAWIDLRLLLQEPD
ncbi:unnamed protein product, partial [Durusdinium trenchii]